MTGKILAHRWGRFQDTRSGGCVFKHGNATGASKRLCDARHRPHARGGNHRDHHGRDGNPRG